MSQAGDARSSHGKASRASRQWSPTPPAVRWKAARLHGAPASREGGMQCRCTLLSLSFVLQQMHCGHRGRQTREKVSKYRRSWWDATGRQPVWQMSLTLWEESSQAFHDLHSSPKDCLIAGVLVVQSRKWEEIECWTKWTHPVGRFLHCFFL